MMTGFLRQWSEEKVYFPKAFAEALAFFQARDPHALAPGKYPIDGENIFVSVQEALTEPMDQRRFELHREYIDIQVLLKGRELQGYASLAPGGKPLEDRLDAADAAFYPAPSLEEGLETVLLQPGQYVIYLPGELHCPCCAVDGPESIFKAVCKIRRSCV